MRLYMHPVSNTSRPILLYVAENKLPVETEVVDLMTGAHHQEPYITLNPNRLVPTLVESHSWLLLLSICSKSLLLHPFACHLHLLVGGGVRNRALH